MWFTADNQVASRSVADRSCSGSLGLWIALYGPQELCAHTIKWYTPGIDLGQSHEFLIGHPPSNHCHFYDLTMFDDFDDPLLQPASIFTHNPLSLSIT